MRPSRVWFWYLLAVIVAVSAMAWMSAQLIGEERRSALEAELTSRTRIALWRMESVAASVLAVEGGRPYFVYRSFYPADRAYDALYLPLNAGEAVYMSPLLDQVSEFALAHFEIGPDETMTSPQAPASEWMDLAIARGADSSRIDAARAELSSLRPDRLALEPMDFVDFAFAFDANDLIDESASPPDGMEFDSLQREQIAQRVQSQNQMLSEQRRRDLGGRAARGEELSETLADAADDDWAGVSDRARESGAFASDQSQIVTAEGVMEASWIDGRLILRRPVMVRGELYTQGVVLDDSALRSALLGEIGDLLPSAALVPLSERGGESALLASLPYALTPGDLGATWDAGRSRTLTPLLFAWAALLMTGLAIAALLRGVLSLSERRASFVSTVTHELRSPLTSIQLYADLLAEDGVKDEAGRAKALQTMRRESARLSRLLENVLSFARLERTANGPELEVVAVGSVVARGLAALEERCAQAEMSLEVEGGAWRDERVRVNVDALEQALFNLVDNACKYASEASVRKILVSGSVQDDAVALRVRDFGPGIDPADRKRLFRPFSKSAKRASEGSRGVGLGLALSRRLMRSMHGDLAIVEIAGIGACFEVRAPRA